MILILNNNVPYLEQRTKINANFAELQANKVESSDEGFTVASDPNVKTFDPATATMGELLDFVATLATTLKTKGVV